MSAPQYYIYNMNNNSNRNSNSRPYANKHPVVRHANVKPPGLSMWSDASAGL